ncbi:hypothetical protein M513_06581 [Trichuris suis]|uniref:DDE-1 domain-containing protein n=1 Tax=Trichuris suis TaxID=68888 RepID=A0A085M5Q1_9BILA|nr:hypothetical protein M513_06581 [Trichuris suis]
MRYRRTDHRSKLLPPNVTSLIQPMDEVKKVTLKDGRFMIAERWWCSIKHSTLKNVWNNIFIDGGLFRAFSNTNREEDEATEILNTLKHLSILDECNDMWLVYDKEDTRFHVLNDGEIVAAVSNLYGGSDDEEEELYDDEMLENVYPSREMAYRCLEVALHWFEMQDEWDTQKESYVFKVSVI